jgi:hypothetical protein
LFPLLFFMIRKYSLLVGCFFLLSAVFSKADNLLPEAGFDSTSPGALLDLTNAVNMTGIVGWRCFTTASASREVHFEIVKDPDDGTHAMKMEMVANPLAETGGRIGFDIDQKKLTVAPRDRYKLTFKAKRTSAQDCEVMVTISGQNEAGAVLAEYPQSFFLQDDFKDFTVRTYSVPEGGAHMNVVFNLVANSGGGQPIKPCGVIIKNIDLEKVN